MRHILSFIVLVVAVNVAAVATAQESWEQKKAAHFKPITTDSQASISAAVPKTATATPKRPRRILVFYRCEGFIHTSIPHGNLRYKKWRSRRKPLRWIWPTRTTCSRPIT